MEKERKDPLKSRKKRLLVFLWALVIAEAVMIFCFSAQNGEQSILTSTGITAFVMRLVTPGFDSMSEAEQMAIIGQASHFVRKAAHFTEFAMLGASLRLLFHVLSLRRPVLFAWAAGALYACTDEVHQMFVDGRGAMWQDVCIDSAGVLAAVLLATLWLQWRAKRRRRR